MKNSHLKVIFVILSLYLLSCKKKPDSEYNKKYYGKTLIFKPSDYDRPFKNDKAKKLYLEAVDKYANLQFDKAEKLFNESIQIEQNANTYNELGICLRAVNRFEESKINFENAIKLDSTFYPAYFSLGNLYANINDDKNSEKITKLMIEKSDSPLWISYGNLQLAALYNNQKDISKAKLFVDKAKYLENVPELSNLYKNFRDTINMNLTKIK